MMATVVSSTNRDRLRILVIDNYDSFVYNLVQYLAQIGVDVDICRNDDSRFLGYRIEKQCYFDVTAWQWQHEYDGIVLSPGPGTPYDAGVCIDVVKHLGSQIPIFGVCLGLQAIAVAFGGVVDRAPELRHGKTSEIVHDGRGIFTQLPNPLTVTRYHSLALDPATVPSCLEISARTKTGVIQALRHREFPIEATQYHPESILTQCGYQMLANWLASCGDIEAPNRAAMLAPLVDLEA